MQFKFTLHGDMQSLMVWLILEQFLLAEKKKYNKLVKFCLKK